MSSGDTTPNCLGEFREIRESKERTRGQKGPTTLPLCQKVGGPSSAPFQEAQVPLTRPGYESGVRDSRGRPAVLVRWLVRPWREIVLKKSQRGEDPRNFKLWPDRSYMRKSIDHREQIQTIEETIFQPLSCGVPIFKTGKNHGKHGRTQKWKHIRISVPCCSVFSVVKSLSAARPRCDLRGSIPLASLLVAS